MILTCTQIGNEGAQHLAEALKKNQVRQSLYFNSNTLPMPFIIDAHNIGYDD
jgi:hypothetical protein